MNDATDITKDEKEKLRNRAREYRQRMRELRICIQCGQPLEEDTTTLCCEICKEHNRQYSREHYALIKSMHRCPRCREKVYGDEVFCIDCKPILAEKTNKRYQNNKEKIQVRKNQMKKDNRKKLKEQGICTYCGKRKADNEYVTCGICRAKLRERKIRFCVGIQEQRRVQGLCPFCGNDIVPGYKVCETHLQKMRDVAKLESSVIAKRKVKEMIG